MRRTILMVTVALGMAAMMMVSAAPGFAHDKICTGRYDFAIVSIGEPVDVNQNNIVCYRIVKKTGEHIFIDDHRHTLI
jgi:hypothetical protein